MTRRTMMVLGLAIAVAAAGALVAALMRSAPSNASAQFAPPNGEVPPALARHLGRCARFRETAASRPRARAGTGRGGAPLARLSRSRHPACTAPDRALAAKAAKSATQLPVRQGTARHVGFRWSQRRPLPALRDAHSHPVRAERVRRGRPDHAIAIAPNCTPGTAGCGSAPAGGGVWRTKNALAGQPNWEYLCGPFGINAPARSRSTRTTRPGNTIYVGTGEANICGSRLRRRRRPVQVDRRRRHLDRPARQAARSTAGASARSPSSRAIRTRSTPPPTTALRGMSSVVLLRRHATGARRGEVGPVQVDRRRRDLDLHPQRRGQRGRCTGTPTEFNNADAVLAARRAPRRARPVEPRHRLRRLVRARRLALDRRRRDVDADQAVAERGDVTTTRPAIAVTTLPNGKTRMYVVRGQHRQPVRRGSSAATTSPPAPRCSRTYQHQPGRPGLRHRTTYAPASAGTTCSSTPRRATRTSSTSAARTRTARPIANKRGVVLSTDAGVSRHRHDDGRTDPIHPNGLHPDQHALVTNPNNPFQFFEANDGGVMRSSGEFADVSAWCDRPRPHRRRRLARCQQMLSRVPTKLESMNKGLTTLQFQSLSVSPFNVERPAGRHPGQRHLADDGQPREVAEHDDR